MNDFALCNATACKKKNTCRRFIEGKGVDFPAYWLTTKGHTPCRLYIKVKPA